MQTFMLVIVHVIFPLFILIGLGVFLHRIFHFDLSTLSKLTTYLFLPAVVLVNIYKSELDMGLISQIALFLIVQSTLLIVLTHIVAKVFKYEKPFEGVFKNTIVLINSGNYGIPVGQLVFQNPLGLAVQVIVMVFQNLLTFTYGLFNAVSSNGQKNRAAAIYEILKLPVIYTLLIGIVLNVTGASIPTFVMQPLEVVASSFLAIALVTLGAQMAYLKVTVISWPLVLSVFGRLIVSPMIAFLIIKGFQMEGIIAQALFIASAFPSSRNSALLALEYNTNPEYAAQAVFLSTLLSGFTVTVVIYLSGILF